MSVIEIVAGALLIVASLVIILVVLAQDTKSRVLHLLLAVDITILSMERPVQTPRTLSLTD